MTWIIYLMCLIALVMAGVTVTIAVRHRRLEDANSMDQTLGACQSLLKLTNHLQQHRGMSTAWLAGDKGFKPRLDAKGGEIEIVIPELRDVARTEGSKPHPCFTLNELGLFQFNWVTLREKLPTLSVEQSIAQHSFLIDQLLNWLAAIGESRVETLVDERAGRALVRNYTIRLPALTECLGQARALGMSVATRRGCSAVTRVRLMFLVARAEALLNQALEAGGHGQQAEKTMLAVQQMARVIRTRMLLSSGVTVAAQDYFELASTAIDQVFAWIADSGVLLRQSAAQQGNHAAVEVRHA